MPALMKLMAWVLTLKPLAGYRTYLGAIALLLAGLGMVGMGVQLFLDGKPDEGGKMMAEGVAAVAAALAVFGLRQRMDPPPGPRLYRGEYDYTTMAGAFLLAVLALSAPAAAADPVRSVQPVGDPLGVTDKGDDPVYSLPPGEMKPEKVFAAFEQLADWGIDACHVPDAWKKNKGRGVKVAVLDTGIDAAHPEFKGRIVATMNFTPSRAGVADRQGHGTHCAGIVLAADDEQGTVGVAPEASLMAGKVLDDGGSGASTWIAKGIDWAVENGADVISLSLGGPSPDPYTRPAIQRAVARGVIVVVAAGNDGPREGTVGYPGGYPESVCVASINKALLVSRFSSRGREVDVAAPGEQIRSTYPGGRYATLSGTSMATPFVAGCAALYVADMRAKGMKPSQDDFKAKLLKTSRDLPPAGVDSASGGGVVQPAAVLDAAGPTPPPAQPGPRPEVIEFNLDDLTPSGKEKLRKLNPNLEGVIFKLKAAAESEKAPAPKAAGVTWHDYDAGVAAAGRDGRPVVCVVGGDWCSWCRKLDAETLADPGVVKDLAAVVCVKVDAQKRPALAGQLGCTTYPTVVVLSGSDRKIVGHHPGFAPPAEFRARLRAAIDAIAK